MYNLYLTKWNTLPTKGFLKDLFGIDWTCKNCGANNNFKKYC